MFEPIVARVVGPLQGAKAVVFRPVIERGPAGKPDYRSARQQAIDAQSSDDDS